jgi:ribosomal protein L7/L12
MHKELVLNDNQLPTAVVRAIQDGRKVEAIKILREATGLGLANAKVLVDRVSRTHGPKKEYISYKDESNGVGKLLASIVAIAALIGAYYYYYVI